MRAIETDDSLRATHNVTGILGLAWHALNPYDILPWWELAAVHQWADRRMGFHLAHLSAADMLAANDADETPAAPGGMLTLGGVDPSRFQGDITYAPLQALDYWRVALDAVVVNGHTVPTGSQNSSIIDTGTSLILGPASQVRALYAHIPGSREHLIPDDPNDGLYWTFPCATAALVDLALVFAGVPFPLAQLDLVDIADGTSTVTCTGSITGVPDHSGLDVDGDPIHWVLGDSFLKSVYSVFRYDPPAVGFARLADAHAPSRNGVDGAIAELMDAGRAYPEPA